MTAYWIVFLLFAAAALAQHKGEPGSRMTLPYVLATLFLALFIGLRWQVGPDWEPYRDIFEHDRLNTFESFFRRGDPAFYVLIWCVRYVGGSLVLLNLICASIFSYGLARFCASLEDRWLGFVVAIPYLVIVIAMSAVRQSVALGFIMMALAGLGRKPLWQTVSWVVIGSLFHASAFIIAVLLAVSYSRNRLYSVVVLILAGVAAYYLLLSTFDKLIDRYSMNAVKSGGVAFRLAMNAVPAAILLMRGSKHFCPPDQAAFWRNLAIFSILLIPLLLVVPSNTVIDRLSVYAIPIQLIVLTSLPNQISGRGAQRLLPVTGIILYSSAALATYFNFGTFARFYIPYQYASFSSLYAERY